MIPEFPKNCHDILQFISLEFCIGVLFVTLHIIEYTELSIVML